VEFQSKNTTFEFCGEKQTCQHNTYKNGCRSGNIRHKSSSFVFTVCDSNSANQSDSRKKNIRIAAFGRVCFSFPFVKRPARADARLNRAFATGTHPTRNPEWR